jgi:hypothetical protein
MSKKILIISQTPTHPQNAGNRIRIYNMVSYLVDQGYEVHFLHSHQQKCDEDQMKAFWKEKYYVVNFKKAPITYKLKFSYQIRKFFNSNIKYLVTTDENYNILIDEYITELKKKISFDVVIVEYIFLSKAFLNFDDSVLKIIDTHDVMTGRHKMFLKNGKEPSWFSTTAREEKKGLDRSDVIIAIQEHEKKFFNKISKRKVVNVGHILGLYDPINPGYARRKLLFVGSKNPINEFGIKNFLDSIYPVILEKIPDVELIIAGKICDDLKEMNGVKLIGEVESMKTAYDMADVIINPLILGTGLKIKMIEALGYSKVVISSTIGAEGLEGGAGESFLIADTADEFVEQIQKVIEDKSLYKQIIVNAKKFAGKWNKNNTEQLLNVINEN